RRTKAEEIRLQGAMEEAFKALEGVAALRRQDPVGARRDRARETNARADVGHGRACKRARMQAESVAARIEARVREARAEQEEEEEKEAEDRAMWQRIRHLDRVAARLEGAEAGIEAKLDLL
ncbi:unnamed protein product, partial [Laminaria digitata]